MILNEVQVASRRRQPGPKYGGPAAEYTEAMDAVQRLRNNGIQVDTDQHTAIAQAYSVAEISIFGSSVRDDIRDDCDINLEQQFAQLFGHPVDIVDPASLDNPVRRHEILPTRQTLGEAANHVSSRVRTPLCSIECTESILGIE